jgi:oleandomycin transport system permease protein
MLGGPVADPVVKTAIWLVALTAIFAPLAICRYRRRI